MNNEKAKCYCGNITANVLLTKPLSEYVPRACDCEFCKMHGAAYISDSKGVMEIHINSLDQTTSFKQGSRLVDLLICRVCGVLVAVTYNHNGTLIGGLNSRTLVSHALLAPSTEASPRLLSDREKIDRWGEIWFSDVTIDSKKAQ